MQLRHPVIQHAAVLALVVIAFLLLTFTANVNPHSTAWLVGAFLCLIVTLVSFQQSDDDNRLRNAYRLYTACMGLYFLVVWLLHYSVPKSAGAEIESIVVLWAKILRAGTIFLPVCYLRFTRIFTDPAGRWLKEIETGAWCAALAFYVTNWLDMFAVSYRWSGKTWAPTLGGAYRYFFYYTIGIIGLATVHSAIKLFWSEQSQQRVRLFYFLIGSIPLWLTIMSNFLLSVGINIYPAAGFFFIAHITILAYAVLRKRVFEVSISLARGLAYAVASLCLGVAYGGLLWFLTHKSGLTSESVNFVIAPLFMAISGFFLAPFVDAVQRVLDRLFFRSASNRQRAFDILTAATSKNNDLPDILAALCHFLNETLKPQQVSIYLLSRAGQISRYGTFREVFEQSSWPSAPVLPSNLQTFVEIGAISEIEIQSEADLKAPVSLTTSQKGLIADISHNDVLLGCVLLHPKLADEAYSPLDRQLVRTAIAHSSLAISNAYSFKKLEELQLQTLRQLNGLNAGVLSIQADGKISLANAAAKRILGLPDNIEGTTLVAGGNSNAFIVEAIESTFKSGVDISNREVSIAGSRQVLLNTQFHRSENQENLVTVLIHDITDYKAMEETVRRNAGLAQAGEMIAGINHEIRNVFQPIRYQVRILNRNSERSAEDLAALEVMNERLSAMDKLLENLKNLARPIMLRKYPLNVGELIESVWRDLGSSSAASKITFTMDVQGDSEVAADGHWLRQVFYNILKNASEALSGTDNPTLRVSIKGTVDSIEISFADNGPGIPAEILPRLFTPFVSTKGAAGTGLGLSISRKAIELHSGTLHVDSTAGGTIFTVRLPRINTLMKQTALASGR